MKLLLILSFSFCLIVPAALAESPVAPREAGGWSSLGLEIGVDVLAVTAVIGMILYLRSLLHRRTRDDYIVPLTGVGCTGVCWRVWWCT